MIVFLFGLPGAGKTYIGQLMQKKLDAFFWDGDEALTLEMRETVRREDPFSEKMTQELTSTIIQKIKSLQAEKDFIVVAQAMLRESDRQILRNSFDSIQFIYIHCEQELLNQRIINRANMVSVSYLDTLIKAFEPYKRQVEPYPVIQNENKTDDQLIEEIQTKLAIPSNQMTLRPCFFTMPEVSFSDLESNLAPCMSSF